MMNYKNLVVRPLGVLLLVIAVANFARIELMRSNWTYWMNQNSPLLCPWEMLSQSKLPGVVGLGEEIVYELSGRFYAFNLDPLSKEPTDLDKECTRSISIRAPAFRKEPEKVTITAPLGKTFHAVFVLEPIHLGSKRNIVVSFGDSWLKHEIGVVNNWGLTVRQAQLVNWTVLFLGFLLMRPWICDLLKAVRRRIKL